ncbi:histidine phosphatase family protein [Rhodoferax sp.]|uniref:histidine phosphatase family protein n=1 Tax=Rhodoferax sp. TaxID=50421 RepID=UPI0025FFC030|nr:histidine phosphatase family protein [Rhodoferax sp.]
MFRKISAVFLLVVCAAQACAQEAWHSVTPGTVVLFRHATAPGVGDPAEFKLNDCRTQRNLSANGQTQARRIGEAFQQRGIEVKTVWSSQWCRTRETADLAFPGRRVDQPLFNSFFGSPAQGSSQTQAALDLLASRKEPGVLVVVTHQVNITALTGVVPDSGEGVVVALQGRELKVLGRIKP